MLLFLGCVLLMLGPVSHAQQLQNGVPLLVQLDVLNYQNFYIDVPPGSDRLRFSLNNGQGDIDLFAKFNEPLSVGTGTYSEILNSADFFSDGLSADELIEITPSSSPALVNGRWYVAPLSLNESASSVELTATVGTQTSGFKPKTGLWWNPDRSGHGIDIHMSGSNLFAVWYTYKADRTPTWYLASAPLTGSTWSASLDSYVWDPETMKATATSAGTISFDFADPSNAVLNWEFTNSQSGSESIEPFIASTAAPAANLTGMWFNPDLPGYGFTLSAQGEVEIGVMYFYDEQGQPRWALGSKEAGSDASLKLDVYQGSCPYCPASTPEATAAGDVNLQFTNQTTAKLDADLSLPAAFSGTWSLGNTPLSMLSEPIKRAEIELTTAETEPGQFIGVQHDSIVADGELEVTFSGANGYKVSVPVHISKNGEARVQVPPFIDQVTGEFKAGQLSVSIPGVDSSKTVAVSELLQIEGAEPGEVLQSLLQFSVEKNRETIGTLGRLASSTGADVSSMVSDVEAQNASLATAISELSTQQATVDLPDGGASVVQGEALRLSDRIVAAYYIGAFNEAQPATLLDALGVEKAIGGSSLTTMDGGLVTIDGWRSILSSIKTQAIPGVRAFGAYVSVISGMTALVSQATALIIPPSAPVTQPIAIVAGVTAIAATAVTTAGTAGLSFFTDLLMDALEGRDPDFNNAANGAMDEIEAGMMSISLTTLGVLNWSGSTIAGIASLAFDGKGLNDNVRTLQCGSSGSGTQSKSNVLDADEDKFCTLTIPPSGIGMSLLSAPSQLAVDEVGAWRVSVTGTTFPHFVSFDWGTGSSNEFSSSDPTPSASHTYTEEGTYPISIEVRDVSGQTGRVSATVTVETDATQPLSASLSSAPSQLKPDESGTWTVLVNGGTPPYDLRFDWDDGDAQEVLGLEVSENGIEVSRTHSFSTAGEQFEVIVDVSDSAGGVISLPATVDVGEALAIECCEGPVALDLNEEGSWTATAAGGDAPYTYIVDLGDGAIISGSSDEGNIAFTYAYTDEASHTLSVTVTDKNGDSAEANMEVQVPEQFSFEGTLTGTWSGSCAVNNDEPYNISGNFTMNVSRSGTITGSFSGSDAGTLSGEVNQNGILNVTGFSPAGEYQWVGGVLPVIDPNDSQSLLGISGAGGWTCGLPNVGLSCDGSWQSSNL